MTRLIDADALNLEYEVDMADDWKTAHEMANIVKYAPTIEAVPVKRGEWMSYCPDTSICSVCSFIVSDWFVSKFRYCPNCGARMDEDE